MRGKKPWYRSTTIQGGIILAATILANRLGLNFGEGEKQLLTDIIISAGEIVGSIMVFWGRLKAKDQIGGAK